MAPDTVEAVLETAGRCWDVVRDAEVTLEANPGSVEAAKFARFAQAGINRVSIGVQSLIDGDLKALGRLHSAAEARAERVPCFFVSVSGCGCALLAVAALVVGFAAAFAQNVLLLMLFCVAAALLCVLLLVCMG